MEDSTEFNRTRQRVLVCAEAGVPMKADVNNSAAKAWELESKGWREWLVMLLPFVFNNASNFSADHTKFWDLFWKVLFKIKCNQFVPPEELAVLLILARGLGKSTTVEAAVLMRGAVLNKGYCLYVCETDDQAREHTGNIRFLIEHPDSRLAEYYSGMGEPKETKFGGTDTWNKDTFITRNGFICRAKGLNSSMRGLRVGTERPDMLVFDDIDDIKDSLAVSIKKLSVIKASILPVQSSFPTSIFFPQNLISEHSVISQIQTGKTDALANRTVIGVSKAFTNLEIDSYIDESTGRLRHKILPSSIASWKALDISKAQKFLDDSGLETFLAEYQNELDRNKTGKVISNYNEDRQIITWSMFEAVFGTRFIPSHWRVKVGLDVGYSAGTHPHYSTWVFVATSSMNSPYPNLKFVYRGRSFIGTSIDDQAIAVWHDMLPNIDHNKFHSECYTNFYNYPQLVSRIPESLFPRSNSAAYSQINTFQMSHERTGEMLTLNQHYALPFTKFQFYGAEDGVAQWQFLSQSDFKKPHPFKPDLVNEDGLFRLGCPQLFYIVDDDQLLVPRDDNGLKLLREQVMSWEYVPVKITDQGQTQQKPSKINDDFCDTLKGLLALFGAAAAPLTTEERITEAIEKSFPGSYLEEVAKKAPERYGSTFTNFVAAQNRIRAEIAAEDNPPAYGNNIG